MIALDRDHFRIASAIDLQLAVLRAQRSRLLRGATDMERSVIATIVSELGSNILKYAGHGSLDMHRTSFGGRSEVEIVAQDAGPGIADVALALTERYSSGATLGLGLPGVQRMADEIRITPTLGGGTTVRVRKRFHTAPERTATIVASPLHGDDGPTWRAAANARPRDGHRAIGDRAVIERRHAWVLLAMIDATGHGPVAQAIARDLSQRVAARFQSIDDPSDVAALLRDLHEASIGTVGAAAGVAVIDGETQELRYLAIGNVRAAVLGATRFTGVSRDGVLGRRWPTPFVQRTRVRADDLVLLWSDGLPEALPRDLGKVGAGSDVEEIVEHAIEALAKPHDDAACIALRWRA